MAVICDMVVTIALWIAEGITNTVLSIESISSVKPDDAAALNEWNDYR